MIIQKIKNIIKKIIIYKIIKKIYYRIINNIDNRKILKTYVKNGKPFPPPKVFKQITVKKYAKLFSIQTLIETGTFKGEMIDATKKNFSKIYSIELDKILYKNAIKKFSKFSHISIIHGDSSKTLPNILNNITCPCLFWLDGHYSGGITAKGNLETPIIKELNHILNHYIKDHVILIDDSRMFIGRNNWPTIKEIKDLILIKRPDMIFEVKDDIIRIYKK